MKNSPGWKKRNITMVKIRWEFLQKITSDRLNQLRKWTSAILLLWEKTHDKKTRHDPIYLFTRLPPTFADTYQKAQHCKDAAGEGSKFYKWHRLRAVLCIKVVTGLTEGKKEKKYFGTTWIFHDRIRQSKHFQGNRITSWTGQETDRLREGRG